MKKIAVVEDNPDNRLLVKVILEPLYEVVEYEDGFSALRGLSQQVPDLLLLDISLPQMDGSEVLRRIRAEENLKHLPVIALTAHAMAGDRDRYLAAGFDDYVTKPIVDEQVLLEAIRARLTPDHATPAAPGPTSPALDSTALERLRKLGGDSFAAEMIGMFLEFTDKKIAEGRAAQTAGDLSAVAKALHPIKSSAGNVGAETLRQLAARVEELAQKNEPHAVASTLLEAERCFSSLKPQLEATRRELQGK